MSEEKKEDVVGTLEPSEKMMLDGLRKAVQDLTYEIGQMELRKVQLIGKIREGEFKAQEVLEGVRKRLDLPQNTMWQVVGDKVMVIKQQN